uniref:Fucolectin tachylectin-4 pentraxin-1 domain-containing protein n=1 Tax=Sinocyclocheilus grahami TaxID=75366 RepID=A0A672REQ5_SINGR
MKKLYKCLWILLGNVQHSCISAILLDSHSYLHRNMFLWSGHTATQSSMYGTWYSENAVDGVRDSCSHTNTQTDPWWRVDLMKVYRVNRVAITNRQSSYSEIASRINGAVIRVGNIPDIYSNPICAVVSTIPSGATASFSCGGIEGRYVTVHIPGNGKVLTLCEVEVYGPRLAPRNWAVDGAATQSSTFGNWFSEKAIDGNRGLLQLYTGCSSTLNETNPWWRVDLRYIYRVSEVVVTNRKDCCAEQINGVEIRIGNSLESNGNNNPICAVIPAIPAGESYSYSCAGMDGRYVNLIIPGDMKMLTLCEVEVYGEADLTDPSIGENILKRVRERNIIVDLFLH